MRWLNPWAWAGLFALALPVLVHLYSRRPPREAPFPSLRFLEASRLLPTRRTRLSDVPLLLLRLLLLLVAVAALAQPLWRSTMDQTSSSIVRAIIVDTLAVGDRSVARATLERAGVSEIGDGVQSLRIETDTPRDVLEGATAWLRQQGGRSQLVVLSDFRDDALDSMDLVRLPRDITTRLVRTVPRADGAVRDSGSAQHSRRVQWASGAGPAVVNAVRNAARASGARAITADDRPLADTTSRVILIASPGADSLTAWTRAARVLHRPWMGDVVFALRHDTALVTASWSERVADTTFGAPFTVLLYTATHAPLVAAAVLSDADGRSRLLLYSRAPVTALATVTLLWSASRALDASVARARSASAPSDAQLQRWEHAPAAAALSSAGASRHDLDVGPSHGRFLWVGVLLLLGLETAMRRRLSSAPSVPATS